MSCFDISHVQAFLAVAEDDDTFVEALREERKKLAIELAVNPEAGKEITTGSGNGVSFTANVNFTKTDRLKFLHIVINAIDNDYHITTVSAARFL